MHERAMRTPQAPWLFPVRRDAIPGRGLKAETAKEWLAERHAPEAERAVFVSRRGGRLSARSADDAVRKVAADAHLQISAHVLRHTA